MFAKHLLHGMAMIAGLLALGVLFPDTEMTGIVQGQEKKIAKKKEKDPMEGKKGTVIGVVTAKPENAIEIKAAGEEKARKYVPQWKGGLPSAGGGLDKEILKAIREIKVGSRVEVEWLFEERLRVMSIKLLKAAANDGEKK